MFSGGIFGGLGLHPLYFPEVPPCGRHADLGRGGSAQACEARDG